MRLVGLAQDDPEVATTGSGATAKFLFDALARRHDVVERAGVDLTPLQRYGLAAATFHPSREVWKTRFFWKWRLALGLRTLNARRRLRRVDQPFDLAVQLLGLFRTQGAPYVLYLDNTIELSQRYWPAWVAVEGSALERLYAWERKLYQGARHVFTMGKPTAESVASFYGVPEDRTSVVGGGANFDDLPPASIGERDPVVLYVGGDWRRKGGDRLIEAFRIVRAKRPDARLQIVGTTEPDAEPGVEVLGFVRDRQLLADLYGRAGIFCLPSRFEPYGLAPIEAMAHGLPCVVTSAGALDEVVLDGETCLVVPPDDVQALAEALLKLLDDPTYARRLGTNARARVESHQTWDAVVDRMTPDLEHAAASGPPPRGRPSRFRRRAATRAQEPAGRGT
jgi:alpha-maltose-1-phosphate synthase